MEKVNSKEYWEERFVSGDWDHYDGDLQSAFFSQIALDAFPAWLDQELARHEWTILDVGCAEGGGTAVLARRFPSCHTVGIDVSETAVKRAGKKYPFCQFLQGDVYTQKETADVIFVSNVLEHLQSPAENMRSLVGMAKFHAILIHPLHDTLALDEHFHVFDEEFFPLRIGDHVLSHFKIIDCERRNSPYWPGEQILAVYSRESLLPEDRRLSDLFDNSEYYALKHGKTAALAELQGKLEQQVMAAETERNAHRKALDEMEKSGREAVSHLEHQLMKQNEQTAALKRQLTEKDGQTAALQRQLTEQDEQTAALKQQLAERDGQAAVLRRQLTEENEQTAALRQQLTENCEQMKAVQEDLEAREEELLRTDSEKQALQKKLTESEKRNADALWQLNNMAASRLFKLIHLMNRILRQGFHKDKAERRKFRKWVMGRFRNIPDMDHRYNPLFSVIGILQKKDGLVPAPTGISAPKQPVVSKKTMERGGELAKHLKEQNAFLSEVEAGPISKEAQDIQKIIATRKYKGILVYPHIVFWEPLQTPQQLLRAFAKEGWLCFFCESRWTENAYREVEPNLIITYEHDLVQALGETPVVVLLTWMGSMSFVDKIQNKKIWYHILDHLEIFSYYDSFYQELHDKMVKSAEVVSYVAKPLTACTGEREDAIYLPNGANALEIANIHEGFVPEDMKPILATGHKIVGYYGYLAEWMDYEMVRRLALSRPQYEFVFIGKAIHDTSRIDDLPNVHLLGLKPYLELSDYAKYFHVATIPFLVDEKMDCVSPIKFYEYLALGLPVVSSTMKELQTFADQWDFVSCADGTDQFLYSIDFVMDEDVQKQAHEHGPAIAAQNSWTARAQRIEPYLSGRDYGVLKTPYTKPDVIVLSIIDYSFRHQRPQHFAQRFARSGHRVFYVNANFGAGYSECLLEENLWQITFPDNGAFAIHLTDWADQMPALQAQLDQLVGSHFIRDALVIVDYPNWVNGALYLRDRYGFRLATDYMDDFTGFLNPAEELVRTNCVRLLKESDTVVASSQFLYDIAVRYNQHVAISRNGTEYAYFHRAYQAGPVKKDRPVIGYYGAISDWFDADIVCRCAERFPECDIVLVGEVTAHKKQLEKCRNIRLIGEVPYSQLLPWLESFDVCLIPFDTSTDLIKATNPVKFYEYLSAGKKVVATEIPELMPYKDKFACLENDAEAFCDRVAECLAGTDHLASEEERFTFAKENDWDLRADVFLREALKAFPKISVIVLCYNQLDYTQKCVESILTRTAYPNYELVLVDNHSTDETAEYLKAVGARYENAKIVLNSANRGFAGGNNDGIAVADGDYLVLLNNDTVVTRGWLTGMVKHFAGEKNVGLVGPVTNSIANEAKIMVTYSSLREMEAFADDYTFRHMTEEYLGSNVLAMFCLMISRELYEQAGPLDEHYGIGMFEDDDYSMAAKKLGYELVIAEDAFVHHFGSVSFKKLEDEKFRELFQKNKKYFEKKWKEKWQKPHFRPGVMW